MFIQALFAFLACPGLAAFIIPATVLWLAHTHGETMDALRRSRASVVLVKIGQHLQRNRS
jgi:hypothetical protein